VGSWNIDPFLVAVLGAIALAYLAAGLVQKKPPAFWLAADGCSFVA